MNAKTFPPALLSAAFGLTAFFATSAPAQAPSQAAGTLNPPVVVSGTSQAAAANTAYVATNAAQISFTLPTTANVGDLIQISGVGAGGWCLPDRWMPRTSGLPISANWISSASSVDGSHLVAVVNGGGLYTSTNFGASWKEQTTGLPTDNATYRCVASSDDGSRLIAVVLGGGIYLSTNSGASWTQPTSGLPATAKWDSVASSDDGVHLLAMDAGSGLYTSANSGAAWTYRGPVISTSFGSVASSSDGSHLVAAFFGSALYTSADFGTSWSQQTNGLPVNAAWFSVASSADGSHLVAVAGGGSLYTSYNYGASWNQQIIGLPTSANWTSVTSSANGAYLMATVLGGGLYVSMNYGATWTQQADGLPANPYWSSVTCSPNGKLRIATVKDGGLYTTVSAAQGATTTLQYAGNGQWTSLAQTQIAPGTSGSGLTGVAQLGSANTFTTDQTIQGQIVGAGPQGCLTLQNRANTSQAYQWRADNSGLNCAYFGGGGQLMTITSGGNVGIGTTTPTQATLVVNAGTNNNLSDYGYLSPKGAGTITGSGGGYPYSIYASARIAATEVDAYSDERIKNIAGLSDGAADLNTLLGIRITDYTFKDKIAKGDRPQKKVIAQQVEQVFPQAVSRITDVVPDIFQKAPITDGWIVLKTTLKKGERVRLLGAKSEGIHEVTEVAADGTRFRTTFQPEEKELFVYGREVKDFRTVDYDALSMLNVSATQQLKKEKDTEIAALKKEIQELKAQDKEREARLVKLEQFIPAAPKSNPNTAATK